MTILVDFIFNNHLQGVVFNQENSDLLIRWLDSFGTNSVPNQRTAWQMAGSGRSLRPWLKPKSSLTKNWSILQNWTAVKPRSMSAADHLIIEKLDTLSLSESGNIVTSIPLFFTLQSPSSSNWVRVQSFEHFLVDTEEIFWSRTTHCA